MRSSVSLALVALPFAPAMPSSVVIAQAAPPPEVVAAGDLAGIAGTGVEQYDGVGYASWYGEELSGGRTATGEAFDAAAIAAAHRTLPLGSYAEVTALDSGRTIVVRIADRGPRRKDREIDLTRGAAMLLLGSIDDPVFAVRVRSITPAPSDAVALRAGRPAADRLDAPPILLAALRKSLRGYRGPATIVPRASAPPPRIATPRAEPRRDVAPARGRYVVQVGTFSGEARARALAARLGGRVEPNAGLYRVRLGPFADTAAAQRARDGVARQGYGDAQILPQY